VSILQVLIPRIAIERLVNDRRLGGFNVQEGACQYRTPKGRACAVGCLISDDTYDLMVESQNHKAGVGYFSLTVSGRNVDKIGKRIRSESGLTLDQLSMLQRIHDRFFMSAESDDVKTRNKFRRRLEKLLKNGVETFDTNMDIITITLC
jgi:hypothetical protein